MRPLFYPSRRARLTVAGCFLLGYFALLAVVAVLVAKGCS